MGCLCHPAWMAVVTGRRCCRLVSTSTGRQPAQAGVDQHRDAGILLPGFALWGLFDVFTTSTGVGLWALALAMYLFTMFGVTLGNHRYWTHRGFDAKFGLQLVLAVASGMSMEGDIQQWVMNHRAHHRFSDVVGRDPHSPYEYSQWRGYKGLVWAQGVWLFFVYQRPPEYTLHRDLAGDRLVQWQRRAFRSWWWRTSRSRWRSTRCSAGLGADRRRAAHRRLMTSTGFVNSVCHKWGSRARTAAGTNSVPTTAQQCLRRGGGRRRG